MTIEEIRLNIAAKGLKVTPQRIAIFEAIEKLHNHPTAENVRDYIKTNYPNIAVGTVYKVLDTFVANSLLQKVKTENGIMRYDTVLTNHHHLYCAKTNRIEDYEDEELNQLILGHFKNKQIKNFTIEDIKLQITGKFDSSQ